MIIQGFYAFMKRRVVKKPKPLKVCDEVKYDSHKY